MARHAAVISSWVAPIPPVVKTYAYLTRRVLTVSTIAVSSSGITRTSHRRIPALLRRSAMNFTFVSCVRPDRISLPMIRIAAVG